MPEALLETTQLYGFCKAGSTSGDRMFYSVSPFSCNSFADLVDGNGESWLNISLHIFLPVVAEKTCSF